MIFISNIKYLKLLRIYLSAINIKISVIFPLVWLWEVFQGSGGKSYFNTRMISKLLCFHFNAQNFTYLMFIWHYLCYMDLKWLFLSQNSSWGRWRPRVSTINVLWRIQNFTMLTMKSVKNSMQRLNKKRKVRNHRRKLSKPSDSNGELKAKFKFVTNSGCFLAFWFCFWVLHLSRWALKTSFDGFLHFSFCLAAALCFQCFSLWESWNSASTIIHYT